jgi:DNA primase
MISKYTIAQVQQTADIFDVVNDYTPLKKRGQNFTACCPFHNEKTPSFYVSPAKGIYKCFGCGASGDSIKFVMETDKMSYVEAIRYLANKYNIPIEEDVSQVVNVQEQTFRESMLIALNYAKNHFSRNLLETSEGKGIGLSYFKERGFNDKTIQVFELGYSMDSWDALTKQALSEQFNLDVLEKAGLTVVKPEEKKQFDRFRARVMFPIHNVAGKVIAFGARILKADKNQPKYLNSPESEVYIKNQVLYGIFQSKNAIRQLDSCFLVEGYTDVVSLHQNGVNNVVASSGTSLTEGQIKLISRYTENITVLYDGDPAGIKASIRGIDLILEQGLNVKVVLFPDKDDPDSYVRKVGEEAFKAYIANNAVDFITFKTRLFLDEAQNDPVKRADTIKEVINSIVKIPDSIKASVFLKQCSNLLEISEDILVNEYNKLKLKLNKQQREVATPTELADEATLVDILNNEQLASAQPESQTVDSLLLREREVIRLLLSFPNAVLNDSFLYQYVFLEIEDIEIRIPVHVKMLAVFKEQLELGAVPEFKFFTSHQDQEIANEAIDMSVERYEVSENWEKQYHIIIPPLDEDPFQSAYNAVNHLKWENIKMMMRENHKKIGESQNESEMENYLMISMELKKMEREIAKILGNVLGG